MAGIVTLIHVHVHCVGIPLGPMQACYFSSNGCRAVTFGVGEDSCSSLAVKEGGESIAAHLVAALLSLHPICTLSAAATCPAKLEIQVSFNQSLPCMVKSCKTLCPQYNVK